MARKMGAGAGILQKTLHESIDTAIRKSYDANRLGDRKMKCRFTMFFVSFLAATVASAANPAGPIHWEMAENVQTGVKLVRIETTSTKLAEMRAKNPARYGSVVKDPAAKAGKQDKKNDKPAPVEPERLLKAYVMRIDLKTPGLRFFSTDRDEEHYGETMPDYVPKKNFPDKLTVRTRRESTPAFLERSRKPVEEGGLGLNAIVAFNTAPWLPWPPPKNNVFADPMGLQIVNGREICDNVALPNMYLNAIFAVYKNGQVEIGETVPKARRKDVLVAHSGFGLLMRNGKRLFFHPKSYEGAIMPRMSVGLSRDKRYMFVVAIDGRETGWSDGAVGDEICDLMIDAGAWDAINYDGGGSATLCYWNETEKKPVIVNHDTKRPVGINLGLYITRN